jgi:tetratricopeptide (TPR) repeat protein
VAAERLLADAVAAVDVPGLLDESDPGLLSLGADVEVDLAEAMRLIRSLPTMPADTSVDTTVLTADILPGWSAAWIEIERERFRQLRLYAIEERSQRLITAGRFDHAVAMAKVAVRTAPSRESARRALIEAYVAQGDLAAAVNAYDEYQELLRSSVGAPLGSGLDGVLGLEGLLPPVPAWPVLRVRRSMQRVGMSPPVFRTARGGSRRLVAGGTVPGTTR